MKPGVAWPAGLAIGLAIGMSLDNPGVGVALGVAFGAGFAASGSGDEDDHLAGGSDGPVPPPADDG